MHDIVAIMRAADFAARKHTNLTRKGEQAEPYLNHLIEVATLVAEATDGHPDAVIAALMHDAVEDQDVTIEEIAAIFGENVAALVTEVTNDRSLAKKERKNRQIAHASHKSPDASAIKLADKTSNLLAIAKSPPPWATDRKRAYDDRASPAGPAKGSRAVVEGLPHKPAGLLAQFEEAATDRPRKWGSF